VSCGAGEDAERPARDLGGRSTAHAPQRLKIIFLQFHDELFVARTPPAIALNTADQSLAVMVDFNKWPMAVGAVHAI